MLKWDDERFLGVDSMNKMQLTQLISKALNGNEIAREKIIQHYKPYIINSTGNIVGHFVTWSDEEASIALLAFNRAIDTYNSKGGRTFLNYAYLLMRRDLIDYYRKEKSKIHLSFHSSQEQEDGTTTRIEEKKSMESYEQSLQKDNLIGEILELSEVLKQYKVSFEELEKFSPKHRDTRQSLIKMAHQFSLLMNLI